MSSAANSSQIPEVSVIIVNWNSKAFVRQCLTSLFAHCPGVRWEVIVVDGGSFDGCDQMLAREFPSAVFVQSEKNVGFARANNLGVRHARGRYLLFLNPDTELINDSISILKDCFESHPQAGAAGCKLVNADRTLQTSCVQAFPTVVNQVIDSDYLRAQFPGWKLWGTTPLTAEVSGPAEVEAVCGACILVEKETFEAVGGFTEKYFMYGEDLDLCFKIKQAGRRVYYTPQTSIVHYGGGSTQKSGNNFSNVMMRESVYRFLELNRGATSAVLYRAAMAASSALRLLLILVLLPISGNRVVRHGSGSLRKWFSIFRWGLGLESWARAHPGLSET